MFNYLPVNFDEDYYCERIYESIPPEDLVFKVVLTYPQDSVKDLSIFTLKEWNTLLAISQVFEDESCKTSWYSDWEYEQISDRVKNAIYFLKYNCEFCDTGFSRLENLRGNKTEILDYIFENSMETPITTNRFRSWIVKSWDILEENLKILSE